MRHALLALALVACSDPLAPQIDPLSPERVLFEQQGPDGPFMLSARRLEPDSATARAYADAEACAAQAGDYRAVQWYVADGPWPGPSGAPTYGQFRSPNVIIVTDSASVAHESKHHVLYANGYRGTDHPAPPFGRCR